jgi:hypothetical protein
MFRKAINKLFEWLFSKVLTTPHGGPGSIPGSDMSVLGNDIGQFLHIKKLYAAVLDV